MARTAALLALALLAREALPSPTLRPGTRAVGVRAGSDSLPSILANDNRVAGGTLAGGVLAIRLEARRGVWRLDGDDDPGLTVLAFGEEGKTLRIPGPMLRVPLGTTVRASVRNTLARDTLVMHGLAGRGAGARDSLVLPPGARVETRFTADRAGTFYYWGATTKRPLARRFGEDSQLGGAFIVDPAGATPSDRVLVLAEFADSLQPDGIPVASHAFLAINGKSWPHTERFGYELGDSIRWRFINTSAAPHPMHLHGFYFRVDARGAFGADTVLAPAQRRMVVTEKLVPGATMSVVWSPDRPGGWVFHCHLPVHIQPHSPLDAGGVALARMDGGHDPDQHGLRGMGGLVLAVTVRAPPRYATEVRPARRLRLFVQSDSGPGDVARRFGYVLQRGSGEPAPDSTPLPGPTLVLTRGEPTAIDVVNRTAWATSVHWHGIEIDSYFDGVAGLSGTSGRLSPAIRPGAHFEARLTPRRAGSFMYHTHIEEVRQHLGGLYGALIVLEPGARWDPVRDHILMVSDSRDGTRVLLNGSDAPRPLELRAGERHRLRLMNISAGRPGLRIRLVRDTTLLAWRHVARDGFELPPAQAVVRASDEAVTIGETVDVEYTAATPGALALELCAADGTVLLRAPLRIR